MLVAMKQNLKSPTPMDVTTIIHNVHNAHNAYCIDNHNAKLQ